MPDPLDTSDRYHRQMLLPGIGPEGQRRLGDAHALLVGCGALGTVIADALARAGIGTLTIVDRDVVEATNLQRQVLFDEDDVRGHVPKAEAARIKIGRLNHQVRVHPCVEDFNFRNAERRLASVDIVLDGLDNFETRYLLNDLAVKHGIPYVYGGAVGTTGVSLPILPQSAARSTERRPDGNAPVQWTDEQATPCLRCVFPEAPPPGSTPTCDTAGVLGPVVTMVAAHQAVQAIKLLTGNLDALDRSLMSIDIWTNEVRRFDVHGALSATCPCCALGTFAALEGRVASETTSLCGRGAIQITPADHRITTTTSTTSETSASLDLDEANRRLAPHGSFQCNAFVLRGTFDTERGPDGAPIELTLFPDGRAIIKGVTEVDAARSIYARYVGS